MNNIIRKGIYRHYKGKLYAVELEGKLESSCLPCLIYRSLEDNQYWIRPKQEFLEMVVVNDAMNSKIPRFTYISTTMEERTRNLKRPKC